MTILRRSARRLTVVIPPGWQAKPDAIGMTWRSTKNTRSAINIIFKASTVRMAAPLAAVCAAYDCTIFSSSAATITVRMVMRP